MEIIYINMNNDVTVNEQQFWSSENAQNAKDVCMHAKTSLFDPWTHGNSASSLMEPLPPQTAADQVCPV